MEGLLLLLFLVVLIALIGVPLWKRYQASHGCGTTTKDCCKTTTTGNCFTPSTFPVKSGLFDLRHCNDEVYIFTNNRSKIHFVEEST